MICPTNLLYLGGGCGGWVGWVRDRAEVRFTLREWPHLLDVIVSILKMVTADDLDLPNVPLILPLKKVGLLKQLLLMIF